MQNNHVSAGTKSPRLIISFHAFFASILAVTAAGFLRYLVLGRQKLGTKDADITKCHEHKHCVCPVPPYL